MVLKIYFLFSVRLKKDRLLHHEKYTRQKYTREILFDTVTYQFSE